MTYRLMVPGWRPTLANELRCHHMVAARKKARDREQIARAMLVYGVPRATGPRHVRVTITGRYARFPDPDAPWKALMDALTTAGAIVDDSAEWCRWEWPVYRRGPKGTAIELEDIEL